MIEVITLDNGLRVATETMSDVASVALGFWVGVGSRDEPASMAGASHFLEHLLFKGTPTRSAKDIAEAIDSVGGEMNAFTTKEYTAFYVRVLYQHVGLALEILTDIISSPMFRSHEVEAERKVILEEILMQLDEPSEVVHDLFLSSAFQGHPLARPVLGSEKSITSMTIEDINNFFTNYYHPSNMVFACAGRIERSLILEILNKNFAPKTTKKVIPFRNRPAELVQKTSLQSRDIEQVHLILGVRSLDRFDQDKWALNVLDQILGGGLSSRLFQQIREDLGLAYSVYTHSSFFHDAGVFGVYVATAASHVKQVIDLIVSNFNEVAKDGVGQKELNVAKASLQADLVMSLEDSGSRMTRIGQALLLQGHILSVEQIIEKIDQVDLERVCSVASKVLTNPKILTALGPIEQLDLDLAALIS